MPCTDVTGGSSIEFFEMPIAATFFIVTIVFAGYMLYSMHKSKDILTDAE